MSILPSDMPKHVVYWLKERMTAIRSNVISSRSIGCDYQDSYLHYLESQFSHTCQHIRKLMGLYDLIQKSWKTAAYRHQSTAWPQPHFRRPCRSHSTKLVFAIPLVFAIQGKNRIKETPKSRENRNQRQLRGSESAEQRMSTLRQERSTNATTQPKHKQNSSKDDKYHVTTSSFVWSKKPHYIFFFMPLSMFRGPSIIERSFIIKSFNFLSPAVPFPTTPEPNP
jgi:hypothetical protein